MAPVPSPQVLLPRLLGKVITKDVKKETSTPESPKTPQGSILMDKYELGKLLGHGSFAKVYLARNINNGENVAIKVIDKEKIVKSGLAGHIKREISILRRVRHPYIVHLLEVMATKTKIYIVMEYVRGGDLYTKVSKGRLREGVARRYFQQLISSVSFCHGRGVYHRDLKLENLLLDDEGSLKVSDFGLSVVSEQLKQEGICQTFCGTPAYLAPEVFTRKGYDAAKADVWSCGVILFVLMAGYLPFDDKNIMVMYKKIHKGKFRCPKWFSPELTRLMGRILDTNPDTRITISEIMKHRWFKKGFKDVKFYIENDKLCREDDDDDEYDSIGSMPRPASLNAFDIISFSSGFDLSGLFEEGGQGARFVSAAPVIKIISKLEEIANVAKFTVRKKDWSVRLEGSREGAKGPLTIKVEIFELTPSLVVVEVKKKGGFIEEYEEFCNKELRPQLEKLMHYQADEVEVAMCLVPS
ncbi:BnaA05g09600D [Brassica napus]|uniref:non-specific serine/threonine protein kinase n=1 Tax=Brassica napus TaxID=3708 RepID=A0A078FXZ7_BRANA|nr:BnaA05g09600D [Brassica napus]